MDVDMHASPPVSPHSVRKELKIRPGFTPTEDVARYKSTGQRDAARLKGYVPGASSATSSTYLPPSMNDDNYPTLGAGLSKSARKHLARKNKKGAAELEKEEAEAADWDDGEGSGDRGSSTIAKENENGASNGLDTMGGLSIQEEKKGVTEEEKGSKEKASLKRAPRPGGGLFRELGIKTKEKEGEKGKETESESDLISFDPPEESASTSNPDLSPAPPPTLAPPISPTPVSTKLPPSQPKLSPSASPSPASIPAASTTTKKATRTNPSPSPVPGATSNKKTSTPGSGSARTRPEPKTRPGFSAMGQINGLLGGAAASGGSPRVRK